MKTIAILLILVVSIQNALSQTIPEVDSISITSKIDDWNQAWKIKDAKLAAKWYSEDADFTNAFGFSLIGASEVEEYLTRVFDMDFVMAGDSEQTSLKLRAISENSILAISTITRKGQLLSDGSELGDRTTTHHRLFKKDTDWRIIAHLISDARSIESSKH
ncbi:MAG: YybH family protein [Balneola sp.]